MMPRISIIVPVYNAGLYLDACIQSIVGQTLKEMEIILIDDGSADQSGTICDKWEKADNRIRVVHKENGGVASARNTGLSLASGEFIGFVDSDDVIEEFMFEKMLYAAEKTGAQIVACGVRVKGETDFNLPLPPKSHMSGHEAIRHLLLWDGQVNSFLWNKIFEKKTIGEITFHERLLIGEDTPFIYAVLEKVKLYHQINEIGYHYNRRKDSLIGKAFKADCMYSMEAANIVRKRCVDVFPELKEEACCHVAMNAFIQINILFKTKMALKNIRMSTWN